MDPLFKKASADFDEGGAKGLLLNHLSIDGQGRIIFDSSDDVDETTNGGDAAQDDGMNDSAEPEETQAKEPESDPMDVDPVEIDISSLGNRFFPDLDRLSEQDICPSLKNLDLGDPSGSLDMPLLKAPEEWRHDKDHDESDPARRMGDASGIMLDDDNAVGFDDDDGTFAGFDIGEDAGFGEGGEAWAREAALEPLLKVHRMDVGGEDDPEAAEDEDPYTLSISHQPANNEHENILSYFDNALQKNWAGPEHWRIRKIKETSAANSTAVPKQRKEKEPFVIDFSAPLDATAAELIYTQASSNSAISIPKTQWKTKGRNLLPDDKHFNSQQLLRLFLKPKARMGSKRFLELAGQERQLRRAFQRQEKWTRLSGLITNLKMAHKQRTRRLQARMMPTSLQTTTGLHSLTDCRWQMMMTTTYHLQMLERCSLQQAIWMPGLQRRLVMGQALRD